MRPYVLAILLLLGMRWGAAPSNPPIIISTVHQPSARLTIDSVTNLLDSLKPDLILLEFDPSFFDSAGNLIDRYRRISLESTAASLYAEKHRVELYPYDITGRNRFYQEDNYFVLEGAMNRAIDSLWRGHQLSIGGMRTYDTLLYLAHIRDSLLAGGLSEINTPEVDSLMLEKERLGIKGLREIVETTPALHRYRAFAAVADSFWSARNSAMLDNIDRLLAANPGKRAVVFCGFEHALRTKWRRHHH